MKKNYTPLYAEKPPSTGITTPFTNDAASFDSRNKSDVFFIRNCSGQRLIDSINLEYQIGVCLGTACYVKGSNLILEKVKEVLGIDVGECTPDGKFSIEATRCIGACGLAPVMTVGEDVYGKLVVDDIPGILEKYADK